MVLAFIISLFLILIILFFYSNFLETKKYKDTTFLTNLKKSKEFLETINNFNDYITWVQRDSVKSEYDSIGNFFKNKTLFYKNEETIKKFNDVFQNFVVFIDSYNKNYVITQKKYLKDFFENIEGKVLDDQQQTAVITDEYSNLIIAGAGSGKTLTILGKVKYLVEKKNIDPENILVLSFTKKTVEELNVRFKNLGLSIEATTFHKLGYDTIKKYSKESPAVTNDNTLSLVVKDYLQKEILNDQVALTSYIQYVACYMNIPEDFDKYDSLGEKIDTEKGIDFQTLKSKCEPLNKVAKATLDTMKGEKVRSVEELTIANFLFLNGINYEYEKPYPFGDKMYRPDFYLKDYDIWLEHFGVDENNRAKWLTPFNEVKYVEEMQFKRELHKTNKTKLLETYSYFNRDNVLLQKLKDMLEKENVSFKPREAKSIYQKITANDERFGKEISKLIESFIHLSKSRRLYNSLLTDLVSDSNLTKNRFLLERQKLFLQFVLPIIAKYDKTLKERNEIDFNDMINHATDIIKENKNPYKYQYIIVDEYQDISYARFNLIKEIRDLCGSRLVCVGDDWQSIYRFAGSDISLFSNFEKYVNKSEKLLIENTYRNSQALINISSKFIQKNPKQIKKTPKSRKESITDPVKFVYYKEESIEETFINEIQLLINKYGKHKILVLGRHSFDIDDFIKLSTNNRIKYIERSDKLIVQGFEDVEIKYITVHKSKGLEADNVIILNLKNDLLGFPNKMSDDPILSLLLSDNEDYLFAEERRLFYVALTRTKNEVVLFIPSQISLFANELLTDNNYLLTSTDGNINTTNCPYCQTGKLIIRKNPETGNLFLGCSHFPICNQTFNNIEILEKSILCRDCRSGFMVKRNGKFGNFLGCSNYPRCNNTINLS